VALVKPIKNGKASAFKPAAAAAKQESPKKSSAKKGGTKKSSKKKKSPAWLHGPISKEEANEVLLKFSTEDGTYLVRSREGKKTEFVLSVIYFKGKPTHHLIKKDDGLYKINNKSYGEHSKVSQLIELLQKPGTPKWPTPLSNPVPSPAAEKAAKEKSAAAAEEAAGFKKSSAKNDGTTNGLGPAWLHKGISREESEGKTFAIRSEKELF
jgi:hypothetical protein